MNTADLTRLYAFNRWANARTLAACEALTSEQLHRDLKSSFPSVHATLAHMLSAEWIWLERWNGSSPTAWPDEGRAKSVGDLRARWADVGRGQTACIAALTEAALLAPFAYRNIKGQPFNEPLGLMMQHVVNHATYHRGQVTTMLRQLGASVTSTDFITFVRETPA
jgi:uncharacterized damage-inducible protein DinB